MNDERDDGKKYNGWTNYQTWLVKLWLDNDRDSHLYWTEQARFWRRFEYGAINLAGRLRGETRGRASMSRSTLYADLLNAALDEVDWFEIAKAYLADAADEWTRQSSSCDAPPMPNQEPEERAAEKPGTTSLCFEDIERLPKDKFDALPEAVKRSYYHHMDVENSPPQTDYEDMELEPEGCEPYPGGGFFGEVISRYTRAQAIEDGVLVDVSEMARQSGFKLPVALTRGVCARFFESDEYNVTSCELLQMVREAWSDGASQRQLHLPIPYEGSCGDSPLVTLKVVCGSDDDASPCITIMLPDED